MNDYLLGEKKNMNLSGAITDLPTLTDNYFHDIKEFGIKN
jgi:hypothetical protein